RRLQEMVAIERGVPSAPGLLPVAMLEDDLRRPFDKDDSRASGRAVQRGHESVLRFKRDRVDPGVRGLLSLPPEADLTGKWVQRPLGRVPVHLPDAILAA